MSVIRRLVDQKVSSNISFEKLGSFCEKIMCFVYSFRKILFEVFEAF